MVKSQRMQWDGRFFISQTRVLAWSTYPSSGLPDSLCIESQPAAALHPGHYVNGFIGVQDYSSSALPITQKVAAEARKNKQWLVFHRITLDLNRGEKPLPTSKPDLTSDRALDAVRALLLDEMARPFADAIGQRMRKAGVSEDYRGEFHDRPGPILDGLFQILPALGVVQWRVPGYTGVTPRGVCFRDPKKVESVVHFADRMGQIDLPYTFATNAFGRQRTG